MTIYVLQQTGAIDDVGTTRTWTFATKRVPGLASDAMARILKPGNFERHAFGRGSVTGGPQVDFGIARLNNRDSRLDGMLTAGLDGWPLALYRGEEDSVTDASTGRPRDPHFSELDLYLKGTTALGTYADGEVQLQLRNRQAELASRPIQTSRYAGDNALPDGVEGTADDLKGANKPIWLGYNEAVPVQFVNTSRNIYQLSDNSTIAITGAEPEAVYDKGVELTHPKIEVSDFATFTASSGPGSGSPVELWWHSSDEGWFIRLPSSAQGTVTVTAQEGTTADTTAAQLVKRILTAHGVDGGSINGVASLDASSSEPIGIWTGTGERTIGDVIAEILSGCIGTWTDDRTGIFTLDRLEVPALEPDHTFERWQLFRGNGEGFRIVSGNEPGSPIPISEAVALYRRNWQVQLGDDLAGSATDAYRAYAAEENRKLSEDNSAVLLKHKVAKPWTRVTLFNTAAHATTAAARYVDLFGTKRFIVEIDLQTETAADARLLQTVSIPIGRFDWDTRNFRVIGIVDDLDEQASASVTTLILWG